MDALKQLNLALWYIEEHLAEDIDYQKVSASHAVQNTISGGCFRSCQDFRWANMSGCGAWTGLLPSCGQAARQLRILR